MIDWRQLTNMLTFLQLICFVLVVLNIKTSMGRYPYSNTVWKHQKGYCVPVSVTQRNYPFGLGVRETRSRDGRSRIYVCAVNNDLPAANLTIRKGDELSMINDQGLREATIQKVQGLFQSITLGVKFNLMFRRLSTPPRNETAAGRNYYLYTFVKAVLLKGRKMDLSLLALEIVRPRGIFEGTTVPDFYCIGTDNVRIHSAHNMNHFIRVLPGNPLPRLFSPVSTSNQFCHVRKSWVGIDGFGDFDDYVNLIHISSPNMVRWFHHASRMHIDLLTTSSTDPDLLPPATPKDSVFFRQDSDNTVTVSYESVFFPGERWIDMIPAGIDSLQTDPGIQGVPASDQDVLWFIVSSDGRRANCTDDFIPACPPLERPAVIDPTIVPTIDQPRPILRPIFFNKPYPKKGFTKPNSRNVY